MADSFELGKQLGEILARLEQHEARLIALESGSGIYETEGQESEAQGPEELEGGIRGFMKQFSEMKSMVDEAKKLGLLDQLKAMDPASSPKPKPPGGS